MKRYAQRRLAEEAARFMADGCETEYLQAKERAMMMLGLSSQSRMPTNRQIKDCIARITEAELGPDEMHRRVAQMRQIAEQIMAVIDDCDPFLIGSTLSGKIRGASDIDLHAYCDDFDIIKTQLVDCGYESVDEEIVNNQKGTFIHLKWIEADYPVEITVYPWSMRDVVPISSVTGRAMKRADIIAVRRLLQKL